MPDAARQFGKRRSAAKSLDAKPDLPPHLRYNTRAWTDSLRLAALARDKYLCVRCGRLATVADHIVPHAGDEALFYDIDNLQALCTRCHNQKTGASAGDAEKKARMDAKYQRIVVYGPEASQYAKANAAPGSIVWDYEAILLTLTGQGVSPSRTDVIQPMMGMLNGLVRSLQTQGVARDVWLCVTRRDQADVLAARIGGSVVEAP